MFASYALRCKAKVEDGSKVVIKGSISLYEQQGSMQCYVTAIRNDGIGDLYLRFEELKKKLFAEGWFDEQHKKKIPALRKRYWNHISKKKARLYKTYQAQYKSIGQLQS